MCPYHNWTYRLSGELIRARYMPEEFDRTRYPLRPVHVREVGGAVYICLAENPPDFAPYAAAVGRQLAPHALMDAKVAAEVDLVEHGNWKLVMENSRECYHCASGHRDLMRSLLDIYDFANPEAVETIGAYWAAWERAGLPAGVAEGPDFRASRLPLVNGARSVTIDGELAVKKPLGVEPPGAYGSLRWVHYPSTFNHAIGDYGVLIRMLPLGPQETLVTTKFLVARDAVEGVDYDLQRLTEVWNITNAEDKALVERNQAGVNSFGYRPGPIFAGAGGRDHQVRRVVLRRDAGLSRRCAPPRGVSSGAGRMNRHPVPRDGGAIAQPDGVVALDMIDEARKRADAAGPADEPAVQPDRHHARLALGAAPIQPVERIPHIGEELLAEVEPLPAGHPAIVGVEAVGNDEMVAPGDASPVRKIVVVASLS